MRNHASSNHHDDMNYEVLSDDIIRFADQNDLEKFTILGHSLGGRTAMTVACRYQDRVDGVISVDSAPIDESGQHAFGSFTYGVIQFMHQLSEEGLSREEATTRGREKFKGKP
jgi:pimeloyl-ACP methyl ester carboxylesterase